METRYFEVLFQNVRVRRLLSGPVNCGDLVGFGADTLSACTWVIALHAAAGVDDKPIIGRSFKYDWPLIYTSCRMHIEIVVIGKRSAHLNGSVSSVLESCRHGISLLTPWLAVKPPSPPDSTFQGRKRHFASMKFLKNIPLSAAAVFFHFNRFARHLNPAAESSGKAASVLN